MLNEAFAYAKPSSFSRGKKVELGEISCATCYPRDIDHDYESFNEERTAFFKTLELDPLPASTGIQAALFRPELLVEVEAIAMYHANSPVVATMMIMQPLKREG